MTCHGTVSPKFPVFPRLPIFITVLSPGNESIACWQLASLGAPHVSFSHVNAGAPRGPAEASSESDDEVLVGARSKVCEASCGCVEFTVLEMLPSMSAYKERLLEDGSLIKSFAGLAFVRGFRVPDKTGMNTGNSKQR